MRIGMGKNNLFHLQISLNFNKSIQRGDQLIKGAAFGMRNWKPGKFGEAKKCPRDSFAAQSMIYDQFF